jgi:hypothetical protein
VILEDLGQPRSLQRAAVRSNQRSPRRTCG